MAAEGRRHCNGNSSGLELREPLTKALAVAVVVGVSVPFLSFQIRVHPRSTLLRLKLQCLRPSAAICGF
jgi:hypothetical protein